MPTDRDPPQPAARFDAVLWEITTHRRPFRPSDRADRLAGLTSAFGIDRRLLFSPQVCPVSVPGNKALIVSQRIMPPGMDVRRADEPREPM